MKTILRSEQAYQALKEKISKMDTGSHLSIRSLATELGMSYTPVREAFLRMEREGTLRQVPNVGFFIQEYNIVAMRHYYQVRECLEPFVLRYGFEQLCPENLNAMQGFLEESVAAIKEGQQTAFINSDIAFHEVIFKSYGNPYLLTLYHSIREQNMYCSKDSNTISSYAIEDHQQLLEAIRNGEKERAVELMTAHIEHAKHRVLSDFARFLN